MGGAWEGEELVGGAWEGEGLVGRAWEGGGVVGKGSNRRCYIVWALMMWSWVGMG